LSFIKDSLLKLFSADTFIVMTLIVYVCGDTQTNTVHRAGDIRAQALKE